ncbi:MAG: VWA domain-containing protein [Planctomycetota bacterium]
MSARMGQRKVCKSRSGSAALQAWVVSVALHLVVLTVFGVVKFSQFKNQVEQRRTPTAAVHRMEELARAARLMPKPKVHKAYSERFVKKGADPLLPTGRIFDPVKQRAPNLEHSARSSVSQGALLLSGDLNLPHAVEFFGSLAEQRKICYVVDCSGSMRGIFREVQKKLKDSVGNMQPDQYFCIIFFGGDKLFEFGGGRLVRATQKTKSAACAYIDSIRPAGLTNALVALERSVQIRDSQGGAPSVIYFLTDGFELAAEDVYRFSQKTANLQKLFAPAARINTIGFWTQGDDREVLEAIARQSGGEFVFVDGGT